MSCWVCLVKRHTLYCAVEPKSGVEHSGNNSGGEPPGSEKRSIARCVHAHRHPARSVRTQRTCRLPCRTNLLSAPGLYYFCIYNKSLLVSPARALCVRTVRCVLCMYSLLEVAVLGSNPMISLSSRTSPCSPGRGGRAPGLGAGWGAWPWGQLPDARWRKTRCVRLGFANVDAPGRRPRAAPWPRQAPRASPPAVRVTACAPRPARGRRPAAARPRPWRRRAAC